MERVWRVKESTSNRWSDTRLHYCLFLLAEPPSESACDTTAAEGSTGECTPHAASLSYFPKKCDRSLSGSRRRARVGKFQQKCRACTHHQGHATLECRGYLRRRMCGKSVDHIQYPAGLRHEPGVYTSLRSSHTHTVLHGNLIKTVSIKGLGRCVVVRLKYHFAG